MTSDLQLLNEFRSSVPFPDEDLSNTTFAKTIRERHEPLRRPSRALARRRPLILAGAALVAVLGASAALALHVLGPSPGFAAGFSAFETLPPASWPDSISRVALDHSAAQVGVSPEEFQLGLRRLRTGLSLGPGTTRGQGDLYAYIGQGGRSACIFLTGQGGGCMAGQPGVAAVEGVSPVLFPGYPGETPAVAAIVADNVASVNVAVGARHQGVPIVNNSIYTELADLQAGDPVELDATYADGACLAFPLANPLGETRQSNMMRPHAGCAS